MFRRSKSTGGPPPGSESRIPRDDLRSTTARLLLVACLLALAPAAVITGWRDIPAPASRPDAPLSDHHAAASPLTPAAPLAEIAASPRLPLAPETIASDPVAPEPASPAPVANPEAAELEIVVTDAITGSTIPNAHVELVHQDAATREESVRVLCADETGRIALRTEPGRLGLVAWCDYGSGGPRAVDIDRGRNGEIEIIVQPTRAVTGRIVDAITGEPLEDAKIAFWTFSERDAVPTDSAGEFRHPRFPAGELAQQMRVEAKGYGPTVRYLRMEEDGAWEFPSPTAPGLTLRGRDEAPWIEIGLYPELRVSGRVLDAAGRPVPGAAIYAEGYYHILPEVASLDLAETMADEAGEFELAGLRLDIGHSLIVDAPGYAERVVELAEFPARTGWVGDIQLTSEFAIAGAVIDQEGLPVGGISIELQPILFDETSDDSPLVRAEEGASLDAHVRVQSALHQARTAEDGTFLLTGLDDHEYELRVLRDDAPLVETRILTRDRERAANMLLTLPARSLVLSGEVRDADGPVVGARVEATRFGPVGITTTDAEGRFRIAGLDDRDIYRITATAPAAPGEVVKRVQTAAWAFESPILRLASPAEEGLALLGNE